MVQLFSFKIMKLQISILIGLLAAACNSKGPSEADKEALRNPIVDTAPLSYDELETLFTDSISFNEDDKLKIYAQICPKCKELDKKGFSDVSLEDLTECFQRLNTITKLYQDSSSSNLQYLEKALLDLDARTEVLNNESPLDINTKLKISEVKSEIHQAIHQMRLKSLEK